MKFMCLGYGEEQTWEAMSKSEQDAVMEECFAYDDQLLEQGNWIDGGQALQPSRTAKSLRWKNGKLVVTDGPFAETKEQLGGVGVMEARDMNHAVELVSQHPGVRLGGPFEIRPIDAEALERNRALDAKVSGAAGIAPTSNTEAAKFACLGITERYWEGESKSEFETMIQQCLAFDEARRKDGQWLGGFGLQSPATAKTVRLKGGKVVVTDGPYAETKEWLGGIVVLGLKDMSHAIEVLKAHPCLRFGVSIEIRPIDEETNARWEARQERSNQH